MGPRPTIVRPELSEREELVLRHIVQYYILNATPVGSRYLSKKIEETSISAATIRNVMADLEEKGFITHPHTSAGRVPTDLGYRIYVDMLVRMEQLSSIEQKEIAKGIEIDGPHPYVLKETSRLIASITNQLGIVTAPELLGGTLERLELVQLASDRLMVILSLRAGLVRTMMLEVQEELDREQIAQVSSLLNERLSGLTIREIRESCTVRLNDLTLPESNGLIRIFLDSADRIFSEQHGIDRIHMVAAREILHQPEFASVEQMKGIVELMENEEVVIHLLEGNIPTQNSVRVTIGSEHADERMVDYSMIATRYQVGDTFGTIGLIGPKRMHYSRLISLVGYVATTLSQQLDDRRGQ